MSDWLTSYASSILALGCYGALGLVQLLVADAVGLMRRHTPGAPVDGGHGDLHFRASRAHLNTMESAASVGLVAGFAIAVGVAPGTCSALLWAFVACRSVHMLAYYFDVKLLRSAAFALGLGLAFALFFFGVAEL